MTLDFALLVPGETLRQRWGRKPSFWDFPVSAFATRGAGRSAARARALRRAAASDGRPATVVGVAMPAGPRFRFLPERRCHVRYCQGWHSAKYRAVAAGGVAAVDSDGWGPFWL